MLPNLIQTLILTIVSISAGILGTVSGGGGGTFVVPSMVATIHESPSVLVGSVFVMYLVGAVTGLIVYKKKGLIDTKSGLILAAPTIPGVVIGTLLEGYITNFVFNLGLGVLTTVLAFLLIFFRKEAKIAGEKQNKESVDPTGNVKTNKRSLVDQSGRVFTYSPNFAAGIAINLLAGFLSGLFGAGAAVIIVPASILFVRFPSHIAIATTRIVLVVLDVSALATHVGIGTINVTYALILSVGGIIGAIIGARIAFAIRPDLLTKVIAIILGILGLYLVATSLV
ncbi:MAG: sulfite exporter TauE/SafE family protein [Nitrososphaerales archaeon]